MAGSFAAGQTDNVMHKGMQGQKRRSRQRRRTDLRVERKPRISTAYDEKSAAGVAQETLLERTRVDDTRPSHIKARRSRPEPQAKRGLGKVENKVQNAHRVPLCRKDEMAADFVRCASQISRPFYRFFCSKQARALSPAFHC